MTAADNAGGDRCFRFGPQGGVFETQVGGVQDPGHLSAGEEHGLGGRWCRPGGFERRSKLAGRHGSAQLVDQVGEGGLHLRSEMVCLAEHLANWCRRSGTGSPVQPLGAGSDMTALSFRIEWISTVQRSELDAASTRGTGWVDESRGKNAAQPVLISRSCKSSCFM